MLYSLLDAYMHTSTILYVHSANHARLGNIRTSQALLIAWTALPESTHLQVFRHVSFACTFASPPGVWHIITSHIITTHAHHIITTHVTSSQCDALPKTVNHLLCAGADMGVLSLSLGASECTDCSAGKYSNGEGRFSLHPYM